MKQPKVWATMIGPNRGRRSVFSLIESGDLRQVVRDRGGGMMHLISKIPDRDRV